MIDQTIANLANLVLKYDELEAKVNGHDQEIADINNKSSYVGKIIMSTALDTLEKVRAIYGKNTTWVKIEGRVLLGASSSYPVKSTGGEASHALTTAELASHSHTFTGTAASHTHTFTGTAVITENDNATHQHQMPYSTQLWFKTNATTGDSVAYGAAGYSTNGYTTGSQNAPHAHRVTAAGSNTAASITPRGTNSNMGSGTAHNNMMPYIAVYIWNRTA